MFSALRTRTGLFSLLMTGLLSGGMPLSAQNLSGSITGLVQDASGALVPGAQIVLINQDQGTEARQTISNESGLYLFSALPGATYTITADLPGFKKYIQRDIKLFVNDKLGLPPITLQVGSTSESITVEAESVQLETVSAERAGVVTGRQMVDIALNGRNFTSLLRTVPGAPADSAGGSATFNGQRANQNNFTVDGQTVTDSGVNQQFAYRINVDAIAEVKVSTSSQGAEFGRNSGAQVQVATKSGSRDLHGGGYLFKRHEGWNANSFDNNRRSASRQIYRFMTAGYHVGGPVYIPGAFNEDRDKLFFFLSHEWNRQRVPPVPRRVRVPTLAERQGDFSASIDSAGLPVTVKDPLTGQAFPGNRIPQERFSPYGPSILAWLPEPNITGNPQYNYESQSAAELPAFDQVYRFDYNVNSNWKAFVRFINSRQTQNNPYGRADSANNLGLSPLQAPTFGKSITGNITTILNPTTTNELQIGWSKNGIPGDAPPAGSPYYRSVSNITIPLLYPNADPVGLIPNFAFDIASSSGSTSMTSFAGLPYANKNPIVNITDNLTKAWTSHTIKAGVFLEYAVKSENPFRPNNSTINFARDLSNPGDTGWAFANALLGNFRDYTQFSRNVLPSYPYWNVEWYGQDTWKVTRKLTLNYGLRVNLVQPLFEKDDLLTNFQFDAYDPAKRVSLYRPALVAGQRVALDPVSGATGPAVLIGAIVPGSGDVSNGLVKAGQNGVPRSLIESRGPQWGPRLGLAYAASDNMVFRAGGSVFYERIATSAIGYTTNYLTNPPDVQLSQLFYGNVATIASSGATAFPLQITPLSTDGKVPTTYNYSAGIQRQLPGSVLLDVSYVGTASRHLVENSPFNAVPFGSAWLPENQDTALPRPVTLDGSTTLPVNLYRPYAGYGGGNTIIGGAGSSIAHYTFGGSSNYNALQASANRRRGRVQFGATYTWSKALGTTVGHLTDTRGVNYGLLGLDRSHGLTFNYIYDLPSLARSGSLLDNALGRGVFSGWQLSGLTSMSVGQPLTPDYTLTGIGNAERNRRITGSEDVAPRVVLRCNPNLPRGDREILKFIDTSCFAPAPVGSIGNDSGVNTVRGPGLHTWDVSMFKKFGLGEVSSRYLQFRVETYNLFNKAQWGTLNTVAQFDPNTGALVNAASAANRDGFGALTQTRANSQRIIQFAAKIYF